MNEVIGRVVNFQKQVFPRHADLYARLANNGQSPKALMISCADSRIVPELILQAEPGDLFVTRNAGNIVPPFTQMNGGVSSAVEYAVVALGVTDVIVCGHSDCGAMKALLNPASLTQMPNVAAWLRHSYAAQSILHNCYAQLPEAEQIRAMTLENVLVQLNHLRTHPSVAAGIARGQIALHGWFVDIHGGVILGLDGQSGAFAPMTEGRPLPIALPHAKRLAAPTPLELAVG